MAVGIKTVIFHLIVVLYVTRTILGELDAFKIRRNPDGSPVNTKHWTQNDNINELRKEIFASLPDDLPSILLKSKTHESSHGLHTNDISNADNLGQVLGEDGTNDADGKLALYNFMPKQHARNNIGDELEKRNGFFFGKRNGFFYGKRDVQSVSSQSCVRCGPGDSGQCVMYGTCCSPQSGCYIMTEESEVCKVHNIGKGCRNFNMSRQCGDSRGKCVAKGVCCSSRGGACHIDLSCLTDDATVE